MHDPGDKASPPGDEQIHQVYRALLRELPVDEQRASCAGAQSPPGSLPGGEKPPPGHQRNPGPPDRLQGARRHGEGRHHAVHLRRHVQLAQMGGDRAGLCRYRWGDPGPQSGEGQGGAGLRRYSPGAGPRLREPL